MILVTVTKKQGVEIATPYDLAIDPEKIVSTRVLDGITQLDYAETFDRNRQTITYEVTAAKPNIDATITGDYASHTYLALTVYWADNRDLRPFPAITTTYALDMQEKYIVDIQDVPLEIVWKHNKISTTARKVRFVPGAFKEEVIYVTNALHNLVDNTPSETTTTTTALPATTTTTEEPVTTTTEIATTTTTVVYDEIYLSNFYYIGAPPPFTQFGDTLESACDVLGMVQSVTLMYTWCYLVPDGLGSFYVYEHYTHTILPEGYYLTTVGEGYEIIYVDGTGLTTLLPYACETTTTTPEPEVTTTTTPIQ
jgi:hypothetical protein